MIAGAAANGIMRGVSDSAATAALAAILTGASPDSHADLDALLACAATHRVDLLLAERAVADSGDAAGVMRQLHERLRRSRQIAAVIDAARCEEDRRVLGRLRAVGVAPVVFKGAALAHTVYPTSYLRRRADIDVLIRPADRDAAARVFVSLGYQQPAETSGALVTFQCHFDRVAPGGLQHGWDVHWKISNLHCVAEALTYDDLWANGVDVARLGGARVPSAVHALMIAALHRIAHHADAPDLLWLYDIHLLAGQLDDEAWRVFAALARERRIAAACRHSVLLASAAFATPVPPFVAASLADAPGDRSAALLRRQLRQVDLLREDLIALPSWGARVRLLREHLFPPASFMAARHGVHYHAALPFFYARRLWTGAPKWFRQLRPGGDTSSG